MTARPRQFTRRPCGGQGSVGLRLLEAQFQKQVTDLAVLRGWEWWHIADSRKIVNRPDGPTAVPDPDCAGLPDLFLARERDGRFMVRELKLDDEHPTEAQAAVLALWARCGVDTGVWRPRNMHTISKELR